ncbi:hypothetical protein AB0B28_03740 [Glycomyces sp. NPDC046736]|uniref:hypothetical protein n=1 Tax=Glycomyces sp. NPDC046736 TaxID=3155615 RepID=UPI0033F26679
MRKRHFTLPATALTGLALLAVTGCSALTGGDDTSEDGFNDITSEVAGWDMCEVLPIEPIKDQVKSDAYVHEPSHVGLGSAMNSEAISCSGVVQITHNDGSTDSIEVLLSVFPGNSAEHVDDMWELRQGGFYEDVVETNSYGLTSADLYLDKDIEGEWGQGHAYAIFGDQGELAGTTGQLIVDVRTENYLVEVNLDLPTDPDKTFAARHGLDQAEIDSRTSLLFDRAAFADWVADEHIHTMFEAVTSKLNS